MWFKLDFWQQLFLVTVLIIVWLWGLKVGYRLGKKDTKYISYVPYISPPRDTSGGTTNTDPYPVDRWPELNKPGGSS